MPAVQWNLLHRSLIDDGADRGRGCFNYRQVSRDEHLLGNSADVELKVLHDGLRDFERGLIDNLGLETLDFYFDLVTADRQSGDLIIAVAIGLGSSFDGSVLVFDRHCRIRDHRAFRIGDGTLKRGGGLSQHRRAYKQTEYQHEQREEESDLFAKHVMTSRKDER